MLVEKVIICERIGEKKFYYTDIFGVIQPEQKYKSILNSFVLKGKFAVYEHALIFEDQRLGCFIAEWKNIQVANIHVGDEMWIELKLIDNFSFPLNSCYENRILLNLKDLYYSKNMKLFRELLGDKI